MLNYRCYLLDKTGRFADTKIFSARDDNDAAAYAFALFIRASSVYDRFEVWRHHALIHAYGRVTAKSDESHHSRAHGMTPPDALDYLRRVDENEGPSEQTYPILAITPSVQRNGWSVTVRSLAIAFALTVSWILMFDPAFLKTPSTASTSQPTLKHISQLR